MNDWNRLTEFMAGHQEEITGAVTENKMLRASWELFLMMAPGLLIKAMGGDSTDLCSAVMGHMGLAYCLGLRQSGDKMLDDWLGVTEEKDDTCGGN